MLEAYKAELHRDRSVWQGETPKATPKAVSVIVTILDEKLAQPKNDGKKMAEALAKIASVGGAVAAIEDVSEWQREQRQDRKISERED